MWENVLHANNNGAGQPAHPHLYYSLSQNNNIKTRYIQSFSNVTSLCRWEYWFKSYFLFYFFSILKPLKTGFLAMRSKQDKFDEFISPDEGLFERNM